MISRHHAAGPLPVVASSPFSAPHFPGEDVIPRLDAIAGGEGMSPFVFQPVDAFR